MKEGRMGVTHKAAKEGASVEDREEVEGKISVDDADAIELDVVRWKVEA